MKDILKDLPEFLYEDGDKIRLDYIGDTDITDEWNELIDKIKAYMDEEMEKVYNVGIDVGREFGK